MDCSLWPRSRPAALLLLAVRLVAAQNGDGGAASGNVVGQNQNGGSGGPSQSAANLSTGATIAIAIIVAIVIAIGVSTAFLFWSAKKRQWTMREQLRHSRRRVTTGLKAITAPLTPGRGLRSPIKTRFTTQETGGLRGDLTPAPKQKPLRNFSRKVRAPTEEDTHALRGPDLEKGDPVFTTVSASSHSQSTKIGKRDGVRDNMKIALPPKDIGISEPPKTPMWNKILGRE